MQGLIVLGTAILSLAQIQSVWTNRLVWLRENCLGYIRVRGAQGFCSYRVNKGDVLLSPGMAQHQQRQQLELELHRSLVLLLGVFYGRVSSGVHRSSPGFSLKHFPPADNTTMISNDRAVG